MKNRRGSIDMVFGIIDRVAREFPNEEALKKYLKEHPNADKSKHTVVKNEKKPEKKLEKTVPVKKDTKKQTVDFHPDIMTKTKIGDLTAHFGDEAKAKQFMDDRDRAATISAKVLDKLSEKLGGDDKISDDLWYKITDRLSRTLTDKYDFGGDERKVKSWFTNTVEDLMAKRKDKETKKKNENQKGVSKQ